MSPVASPLLSRLVARGAALVLGGLFATGCQVPDPRQPTLLLPPAMIYAVGPAKGATSPTRPAPYPTAAAEVPKTGSVTP